MSAPREYLPTTRRRAITLSRWIYLLEEMLDAADNAGHTWRKAVIIKTLQPLREKQHRALRIAERKLWADMQRARTYMASRHIPADILTVDMN